ncbi:MAG TPA: glycoside hydrolase family 32 protein [Chthoniobacterales bacterium]
MQKYLPLLLASAVALTAPAHAEMRDKDPNKHPAPLYDEQYRPQFHYSPPVNFMNDPNGLVYFDGTYHLYFQYNATGITAGNQNWGHATSADLIHWQNATPFIAIPSNPATNDFIYSGSAVVDSNNTSGFFNGIPGGGLVAIYTLAHWPVDQWQNIAYSLDGGFTYTNYTGNPVINIDDPNFRDPFVFWYPETQRWVMAIALSRQHQVLFYDSPDLKEWRYLSSFGPAGTPGVDYEVPALVHVPVEGTNEKKWVLLVSINPGAPQGGSATQYFIGDFDGTTFTPQDPVNRWMEFGKDAYAMITYNNLPTDDVVAITWVGNWQYSQQVPTSPWRSAQSVARYLTLRQTADEGLVLVQQPISLASLRDKSLFNGPAQIGEKNPLRIPLKKNTSFEFEATISADAQQVLNIDLEGPGGEKLTIGYDWGGRHVYVNRGDTEGFENPYFTDKFSSFVAPKNGQIKLHALVDRSILELYVNDGERVATTVFFMEKPATELRLSASNGTVNIQNLSAYTMKSIWR